MLGLAMDSAWHATVNPQHASDLARRTWQAEHDALIEIIENGLREPPKLGSLSKIDNQVVDLEHGLFFEHIGSTDFDPDKSKVSCRFPSDQLT
jgi:hypothetical protein